jgi:hypothetical protein
MVLGTVNIRARFPADKGYGDILMSAEDLLRGKKPRHVHKAKLVLTASSAERLARPSSSVPLRGILRNSQSSSSTISSRSDSRLHVSQSDPTVSSSRRSQSKSDKHVEFQPDVKVRVFVSSRESREYRRAFMQAWRRMRVMGKWAPPTSLDDLIAETLEKEEEPAGKGKKHNVNCQS